jgi:hypothetical protein
MRRFLGWPGLLVILFGLVVLVSSLILHYHVWQHWTAEHVGAAGGQEANGPYAFWSGFGSDIGEYTVAVGVFSTLYHAMKRNNCNAHRCWRIAHLPIGDGSHKVCKHHHLEITGGHPTVESLKAHHERHLAMARRANDGTS